MAHSCIMFCWLKKQMVNGKKVRDWPYIYWTENFAYICISVRMEVTSGVVCFYRVMRAGGGGGGGGGSYRYTSLCHRKWLSFTAEVSWRESCDLINEASQCAGHSSVCVVLMANRILTHCSWINPAFTRTENLLEMLRMLADLDTGITVDTSVRWI